MAQVSAANSVLPRNRLLARVEVGLIGRDGIALTPADLGLLQPHLQSTGMALLKDLERPNRRIETVYFFETGIGRSLQPNETRERDRRSAGATNRRIPPTSKSPVKRSGSQPRNCATP
jgi:hypothetical protein